MGRTTFRRVETNMSDDWRRVTDEQICTFTGLPSNPETARFERILQVRLTESVGLLSAKLTGLMETIYRSTGRVSDRTEALGDSVTSAADRLGEKSDALTNVVNSSSELLGQKADDLSNVVISSTERLSQKADELRSSYERIADSQSRQQRALILLSVVVSVATVAYTVITWQSVQAMRAANDIQRQMLAAQQQAKPVESP
jgi:hypothetical protein